MRTGEYFQKSSLKGQLSIEDYTKAFIIEYQTHYNEQQLAAMLGITRKSLWEKRKKWGIDKS
jgi:two-component system response regulator PilR (NtrC family)